MAKAATVYDICDSFGLAGSRELNQETLRRCHQHLAPGGVLIINIEALRPTAGNCG